MADLRIARGLAIPADFVTQTAAILARKGAGKTYTAKVLTEELVAHGLQTVVLDPLGAWWGLRAAANGKDAGLPVTILGGAHGDLPLEPTAGVVVADLVAHEHVSVVIDLSGFESGGQQDRFVTDFAERLYRAKAKQTSPLHLMVDEADEFAPQRPRDGQQRMLGAMEAIVRRGRIRGLGCTLITQRPAVLNKNVLTQAEMLIVLQMTAPQDRKAIDDWVISHGTKAERDQMLAKLSGLQRGEAFVWSPSWLDIFRLVQIRTLRTFDSSRTPAAGEKPVEPRQLAAVDLDSLRARMAETVERADATNPKKLQARIRELEQKLAAAEASRPQPVVERVEVPVPFVPAAVLDGLRELAERAAGLADTALVVLGQGVAHADHMTAPDPGANRDSRNVRARPVHPAQRAPERPARVAPPPAPVATRAGDTALGKAERKILTVLAQYPDGRTKTQLTTLTGYAYSGGFRNYLSALRTAGLIEGGNQACMRITEQGIAELGDAWEAMPVGPALLDFWLTHKSLGKGERKALAALVDAYPAELTGPDLAAHCGYEFSGGFRNYLSRLRTLKLIVGSNTTGVRAHDDFMEAITG